MAIRQKESGEKLTIDLTGPQGNAFALLGTARWLASQLSLDGEKIRAEMMTGDYEHLIQVFDNYFGDYVDLLR